MRFLVTPEFSEKLASLSPSYHGLVKEVFSRLKDYSKEDLLASGGILRLPEDSELYVYRYRNIRVFLTFVEDKDGEFALLADILGKDGVDIPRMSGPHEGLPSRMNPKLNSKLNPFLNSSINPNLNSRINPNLNSRINPKLNSRINPNLNSRINPKLNSRINPKLNSRINPRLNSSINPKHNWSINPNNNSSFQSEFVYTKDFVVEYYVVKADGDVSLIFDMSSEWRKFSVRHDEDGYVVFDLDGIFVEHWESNGRQGFNKFTIQNLWVGFVL